MKPVTVNVVVFSAKGLKSKTGKHKFCVQVKVGRRKEKTNLSEDLFGNPSFNKEFLFSVDSLKTELKLKVTEKNDKDVLGQVIVQLTDLGQERNSNPERVPLRAHKKCPQPIGELLFEAWVTGLTTSHLDLARNSGSTESLKSLGSIPSGLKKLKEKLHTSALKLHHPKQDKSEVKKSHLSIFGGKNKGSFGSKDRAVVSCQDLSGSSAIYQPDFFSGATEIPYFDSDVSVGKLGEHTSTYTVPPPEVTGLSPKSGDSRGGTVVTIRGTNLGQDFNDVLHVYVCGVDTVDSIKYVSPSKLICTTLPCNPCSGNIIVETRSGGLGASTVEFSFCESQTSQGNPLPHTLGNKLETNSPKSPVNFDFPKNVPKIAGPGLGHDSSSSDRREAKLPVAPPRNRSKDLEIIRESFNDDYLESLVASNLKVNADNNKKLGFDKLDESESEKSTVPPVKQSSPISSEVLKKDFQAGGGSKDLDQSSNLSNVLSASRHVADTKSTAISSKSSYSSLDKFGSDFTTAQWSSLQSLDDKESGNSTGKIETKDSKSISEKSDIEKPSLFFTPRQSVSDIDKVTNGNGFSKPFVSLHEHDLSTPESIRKLYNSSDAGLAERLSQYYQKPEETKVKPEKESDSSKDLDKLSNLSNVSSENKPYNKFLSKVSFSIAGDSSSDDESVGKKSKSGSGGSPQSSQVFKELVLPTAPTQNYNESSDHTANQITGKQIVEIQPISRLKQEAPPSKTIISSDNMSLDGGICTNNNELFQSGIDMKNKENKIDITKTNSETQLFSSSRSSPSSPSSVSPPIKPPRVKELAELNRISSNFTSDYNFEKPETNVVHPIPVINENDEEEEEKVKRLKDEISVKDASLLELKLQNKTLQEERNLLRRYIEVLISRALTSCPEILCTDDGHISLC